MSLKDDLLKRITLLSSLLMIVLCILFAGYLWWNDKTKHTAMKNTQLDQSVETLRGRMNEVNSLLKQIGENYRKKVKFNPVNGEISSVDKLLIKQGLKSAYSLYGKSIASIHVSVGNNNIVSHVGNLHDSGNTSNDDISKILRHENIFSTSLPSTVDSGRVYFKKIFDKSYFLLKSHHKVSPKFIINNTSIRYKDLVVVAVFTAEMFEDFLLSSLYKLSTLGFYGEYILEVGEQRLLGSNVSHDISNSHSRVVPVYNEGQIEDLRVSLMIKKDDYFLSQLLLLALLASISISFVLFTRFLVKNVIKKSMTPLEELLKDIEIVQNSRLETSISECGPEEIKIIRKSIEKLRKQTLQYMSEVKGMAKTIATNQIAKQVAHDIRSPLAALDMIMKEINQLPEEHRSIIRNATRRIHDIADNLLSNANTNRNSSVSELRSHMLSGLIAPLLAEKRTQYRNSLGLDIEAYFDENNYGVFVNVNATEFQRVLSNLINNSVEALNGPGKVKITSFVEDGVAKISIEDNGPGIDPKIISTVVNKGVTHGKKNGSGLGLFHAKESVESWNGEFQINSMPKGGCSISITLPIKTPPKWFLSKLLLSNNEDIVILDDDKSIHQTWSKCFGKIDLKSHGISLHHFSGTSELKRWYWSRDKNRKYRFLFDYELLGSSFTGLDLIEELSLKEHAILVTSYYDDEKIIRRCLNSNVCLIPKSLVPFVPISMNVKEEVDALFVDDDLLIRNLWKMSAKKNSVKLKTFSSSEKLLQFIPEVELSTPIYIDSSLGESIKGEDIAKTLSDKGYENIYLATGHDPSSFTSYTFLNGVIGKEPPWSI